MATPTTSMPDAMLEAIDTRRASTTPRSQWVREAIAVRLLLEDTDEFDSLLEEARTQYEFINHSK